MAKDLMMWVGEKYYPTIEKFIAEARSKGVCKRIGTIPNVVKGKSRCFLLHRNGTKTPRCFGYFNIWNLCCMVTGADLQKLLKKYGASVNYVPRSHFPEGERGCGEMVSGGLYLITKDVLCFTLRNTTDIVVDDGLVVLKQPYPKMSRHLVNFRGYQYIDGDALLETFQQWYRKHERGI